MTHDVKRQRSQDRPRRERPRFACGPIATLLLEWQSNGHPRVLEAIIEQMANQLEQTITRTLRKLGVRDGTAVDDTLAIVLDHLRRLPGAAAGERAVNRFTLPVSPDSTRSRIDPGAAFLKRLSRDRAYDVVRARRRRRSVVFSQLSADVGAGLIEDRSEGGGGLPIDRVRQAAATLEPRERAVVELLLEGQSQRTIATALALSEGTVSRLRSRAIESLRQRFSG